MENVHVLNLKSAMSEAVQQLGGLPEFNEVVINETDPEDILVTYKLDSTTVATKSILISGAITTITTTIT